MNKILSYLNKVFRNDGLTKVITDLTENNLKKLDYSIEDIERNIFLDTAIWGLALFEKELWVINISKTEDERRAIIRAKWIGRGKAELKLIENVIKTYVGNNVKVSFKKDLGLVIIIYENKPYNFKNMLKSLEESKPAHLGFMLESRVKLRAKNIYNGSAITTYDKKQFSCSNNFGVFNRSVYNGSAITIYDKKQLNCSNNFGMIRCSVYEKVSITTYDTQDLECDRKNNLKNKINIGSNITLYEGVNL